MNPSNANRKRSAVVLKLARISVPHKVENARHYVTMMTGNINFTAPHPTLAEVISDALLLEQAFEAARDGSRSATQLMYDREATLDNRVTELAHYVEYISNTSTTPESVITSAGMQFKTASARDPRVFSVKHGRVNGDVDASTKAEVGKASYIWEFRKKDSAEWIRAAITVKASYHFSGLTSGSTYEFRLKTITSEGEGDFLDTVELLVL